MEIEYTCHVPKGMSDVFHLIFQLGAPDRFPEFEEMSKHPDPKGQRDYYSALGVRYRQWCNRVSKWRTPYGPRKRSRRPVDYGTRRSRLLNRLREKQKTISDIVARWEVTIFILSVRKAENRS